MIDKPDLSKVGKTTAYKMGYRTGAQEVDEQVQRLKDLEYKLKKAKQALADIFDGEPEWPDDPQRELDWCRDRAKYVHTELETK